MDIKSTKEVVETLEVIGVAAKKIAKDGINLADIPEAVELIKHIDLFVSTVKDFHLVGQELKDIDQAEIMELGVACFNAFKAIKEA